MLKEIKERHEIVNRVIDDFKGPVIAIRQAHQDRAYLLLCFWRGDKIKNRLGRVFKGS